MDSVERFAYEASQFEEWLLRGTDREADAVRWGLIRLTNLYRAALDLPPAWSPELERTTDPQGIDETSYRRALEAARRLPLDMYQEIFNPFEPSRGETVTGSVADDLADTYQDVATGLRAYEQGHRANAVWEWSFRLHSHWGAHATSAIRALHWWLVENAIDRLSVDPDLAS